MKDIIIYGIGIAIAFYVGWLYDCLKKNQTDIRNLKAQIGGTERFRLTLHLGEILRNHPLLDEEFKEDKEFKSKEDWVKNTLKEMVVSGGDYEKVGILENQEECVLDFYHRNGQLKVRVIRKKYSDNPFVDIASLGLNIKYFRLWVERGMLILSLGYGDSRIVEFPLKYLSNLPEPYLNYSLYSGHEINEYAEKHNLTWKKAAQNMGYKELKKEWEDVLNLSAIHYDDYFSSRELHEYDKKKHTSIIFGKKALSTRKSIDDLGFIYEASEDGGRGVFKGKYLDIEL